MTGLTLAGIAGLAVLGAVVLRSGLRRMAEEDVPYAMKYILVSLSRRTAIRPTTAASVI